MLILLMRHGVAEDAGPGTLWRDEPRALTDEGRARMRAAAEGVARLGFRPEALVTSPLTRCVETAEILGLALDVTPRADERLRPGMDVAAVLGVVLEHPEAETLLVCGHQPDLSNVTADLIGGWIEFKKGALAVVELEAPRPRAGLLLALYPPSALRRLGA